MASAYQKFMSKELKGKMKGKTPSQRKRIFKAAVAKWNQKKKGSKGKSSKKKPAKAGSKNKTKPKTRTRIVEKVRSRTVGKTIGVSATSIGAAYVIAKPALEAGALDAVGSLMNGDINGAIQKVGPVLANYKKELPMTLLQLFGIAAIKKGASYFGMNQIAQLGPLRIRA